MSLREMLSHNLGLKIMSLFLAMVLWLFVAAEKDSEISLSVPLEITNLPAGIVVVNQPRSRVDVRVAGPEILLMALQWNLPKVCLDMKDAHEGTTEFPGLEKAIRISEGVRVTQVAPATVKVSLARAGAKGNGK
jgi:YbbR domain-containing protein